MKFSFKIVERSTIEVEVEGDCYEKAIAKLNRIWESGELNIDKYGDHESDVQLVKVEG